MAVIQLKKSTYQILKTLLSSYENDPTSEHTKACIMALKEDITEKEQAIKNREAYVKANHLK